jgi:nicotinate phosphoribosyltransferase
MIISSLLDTDLYKFTMMQVVLHQYPAANVEYRFRCRTPGVDLVPLIGRIREELDALCSLRFTDDELAYLRAMRFIDSDFVDFLGLFHLNAKYVTIAPSDHGPGEIDIIIAGPWLHTIMFEVPLLAIVNELYFEATQPGLDLTEGRARLQAKMALLRDTPGYAGVRLADYGTRRRFSRAWHEEMLLALKKGLGDQLVGTSNVWLAKRQGLVPLGSMAHEYLQAFQSLGPRLRDSQTAALEAWAREYRGDLGIALSDVYGLDAFLRHYDIYF